MDALIAIGQEQAQQPRQEATFSPTYGTPGRPISASVGFSPPVRRPGGAYGVLDVGNGNEKPRQVRPEEAVDIGREQQPLT